MIKVLTLAAVFVISATAVSAQTSFTLGGVTAAPGTLAAGTLRIAPRAGDSGTEIPFSIVHGVKNGPVLALVAGTHGKEKRHRFIRNGGVGWSTCVAGG